MSTTYTPLRLLTNEILSRRFPIGEKRVLEHTIGCLHDDGMRQVLWLTPIRRISDSRCEHSKQKGFPCNGPGPEVSCTQGILEDELRAQRAVQWGSIAIGLLMRTMNCAAWHPDLGPMLVVDRREHE